MSDIRWEIDALIQRWLDAYPKDIFPDDDRAVRLARHILQSLSVEIEAICMDHAAKKETNT